MSDLISRQAAIDALEKIPVREFKKTDDGLLDALISIGQVYRALKQLPPVQPVDKDINVSCKDAISRQDAIDAVDKLSDKPIDYLESAIDVLVDLPSVQPEPLSDAYMKAVWTWLLDYQIKAAELKGRYTPYEVLSWVANDWRKEHE